MPLPSTSKHEYITCDPDKCIGCQICEYVCSYAKTGEFNTFRSRIRMVRDHKILITTVACRTCENAPCAIACPRDALKQDPKTGVIKVDTALCDGCAWCIEACDFGAISINPRTKLAEICDLCEGEEDGPQCVKWCPKDALEKTTPDRRAQRSRRKLAREEILR
ncbi:MAG: 4Fe-4S dicluster domain-containing protein [Anaerolineales bacterium]|nr:4Fe-4S dicluster domain-containing protein [Anaerolineales bacterium]